MTGDLLLVGCGNMGGAMLRRWLDTGLDPARVTVVSPSGRAMPGGVRVVPTIPAADGQGATRFGTVMLALKPQQLRHLQGSDLAGHAPRLLLSILAGVTERRLATLCPAEAVVRIMPNLPVAIGKGVVAMQTSSRDAALRAEAEALMQPLGLVEWIADEALFDAVTALSGCGPAFVYRFIDAMAAAGASLGLPQDQAARLAVATVEGAGLLAAGSAEPASVLADRVASPGGSTREGLNVLDDGNALAALLARTLAASARRNGELAAAAAA